MKERSVQKETGDRKFPCKYCGSLDLWYTSDETWDGAYDRYHYHCHSCGKKWTVVDETD